MGGGGRELGPPGRSKKKVESLNNICLHKRAQHLDSSVDYKMKSFTSWKLKAEFKACTLNFLGMELLIFNSIKRE